MKKIIHWMLSAAIRPLVLTMVFCGASVFNIDFGEQGTQTVIGHTDITDSTDKADAAWYTIDGRKLSGKPSVKGVYVNNGRKVIIK
jgi:hypothetical protein